MLELRVTNDKDRGQISEDRNQKTEVSGQRTEDGKSVIRDQYGVGKF